MPCWVFDRLYLPNRICFLFLHLLRCFNSVGSSSLRNAVRRQRDVAFGNFWFNSCLCFARTYRNLLRPSSVFRTKLSTSWFGVLCNRPNLYSSAGIIIITSSIYRLLNHALVIRCSRIIIARCQPFHHNRPCHDVHVPQTLSYTPWVIHRHLARPTVCNHIAKHI